MLNLNANEKKTLKFGVSVAGVQARDLAGALRLEANGIEYGFPVSVRNDKVEVEIPPLEVFISEITDDSTYNVKLELIANDTYIVPWTDVAKVRVPVSVKVSENVEETSEKVEKVTIGITKIDEKNEPVGSTKTPRPPKKQKVIEKKKTKFGKFLNEGWKKPKGKMAGWIAMYNGKKLEIKKSEAKDLYGAKQLAIKHFKVPKFFNNAIAKKNY